MTGIPGIGALNATALVAAIGIATTFRKLLAEGSALPKEDAMARAKAIMRDRLWGWVRGTNQGHATCFIAGATAAPT